MKCPTCGGAELMHEIRNIEYIYKGEKTLIPAIEGDYCSVCGEGIHSMEASEKLMQAISEFQKQVNSTFIDPIFVTSVRRKLGLDQKEAATIFGGGVNAFSRYETGKTKPPLSLVKLLKLLNKYPDLLEEIKT